MITKEFIDKNCIYPNFPIEGIKFVDIFPCLEQEPLIKQLEPIRPDLVGIILMPEARGFLFYDALVHATNYVVPLRKKGKMPGKCIEIPIQKEYGFDTLYLQVDALLRAVSFLKPIFGRNIPVVLWDDLLATGGTALGTLEKVKELLITDSDGEQICFNPTTAAFYMELESLAGRQLLESSGYTVSSVIKY